MNTAMDKIMKKAPQDMTPLEECIGWFWLEGPYSDEGNHELAERAAQHLEILMKFVKYIGEA
jgi:hypothetical protein